MNVLSASGDPDQLAAADALVAGTVGDMGLLISAFRSLRSELKDEMRAGEDRMNKCID